MPSDAHCVMEASGPYYLQLASHLKEAGFKVSVVNPLVVKRFAQMKLQRAKTDKKDAKIIAMYVEVMKPEQWLGIDSSIHCIQQIMTLMECLKKQKSMLRNQLEAFNSSGIIESFVTESIESMIVQLDEKLVILESRLEQVVLEKYKDTYQRLLTIPAIGKKAATMLIVLTSNFTKLDNYKQLIAYIGFSPRIYQSGTSINGKGHICKMGNSQARKTLYMCSWSAKFHNSACRDMFDRLIMKGKPERVIKVAIANKLIKQAFAIATSKSVYQENYLTNACI